MSGKPVGLTQRNPSSSRGGAAPRGGSAIPQELEHHAGGQAYSLAPHACRHCGGRVLQSGDMFRCGGCGAVAMGSPSGICGCGLLRSRGSNHAGFRCVANPARSPQSPAEIVIEFGEVEGA